jgi:hypothetical protein
MTNDVTGDVTPDSEESQENPDAPWRFTVRGRHRDRAIVQRVVEAHARMGLTISLNDAVLVLIRRSATPDADSQEEAWQQIERHWADCPGGCDFYRIKCPEGWRLYDQFHRVRPRDPAWRPPLPARRTPAPPPPPITSAPATSAPAAGDVVAPQRWRRYLGIAGRKAS